MTEHKGTVDSKATIGSEAAMAVPSSAPMTRQQILDKLAETARQKRAARLAAEGSQQAADESWKQQTLQVLRFWLAQ